MGTSNVQHRRGRLYSVLSHLGTTGFGAMLLRAHLHKSVVCPSTVRAFTRSLANDAKKGPKCSPLTFTVKRYRGHNVRLRT